MHNDFMVGDLVFFPSYLSAISYLQIKVFRKKRKKSKWQLWTVIGEDNTIEGSATETQSLLFINSCTIAGDSLNIRKKRTLGILKYHKFYTYQVSIHKQFHGNDLKNLNEFYQWGKKNFVLIKVCSLKCFVLWYCSL